MEATEQILNNAHKITYMVQEYPDKTQTQIIELFQMSPIDINTAIWYAIDCGFLSKPENYLNENGEQVYETGPQGKKSTVPAKKLTLLATPDEWQFGKVVDDFKAAIVYAFNKLAETESDLEEQYLGHWTMGYSTHDYLVTIKQLLSDHVLGTYELTDPEDLKSTYTYYSLFENVEQMWGKKNFKVQPTGEEKPDTSEPTSEEGK